MSWVGLRAWKGFKFSLPFIPSRSPRVGVGHAIATERISSVARLVPHVKVVISAPRGGRLERRVLERASGFVRRRVVRQVALKVVGSHGTGSISLAVTVRVVEQSISAGCLNIQRVEIVVQRALLLVKVCVARDTRVGRKADGAFASSGRESLVGLGRLLRLSDGRVGV